MKLIIILLIMLITNNTKLHTKSNNLCLYAQADSVRNTFKNKIVHDSIISKIVYNKNMKEIIYSVPDISFCLSRNDTTTILLLDEKKEVIKPILHKYMIKGYYQIFYSYGDKYLKRQLKNSPYHYILIYNSKKYELIKAILIK